MPLHSYDLALEPDLEAFTFKGKVDITLTLDHDKINSGAAELAHSITLHAKELTFVHASYKAKGSEEVVEAEEIRVNLKATTVQFIFGAKFPPDATSIVLTIQYTGFL